MREFSNRENDFLCPFQMMKIFTQNIFSSFFMKYNVLKFEYSNEQISNWQLPTGTAATIYKSIGRAIHSEQKCEKRCNFEKPHGFALKILK